MAGQPKRHKLAEQIEALGGTEWFCGQIADGHSLRKLAVDLDCSRWLLQKWIGEDPDRKACYEEAKLIGASAMVEEGKEIIDNADEKSTAGVQKARHQAEYRRWYAGVIDRPSFGPPNQRMSINVLNIENLHLAALQAHGGPDAQKLVSEPVDVPLLKSGDKEAWETSETE